MRSYSSAVRPDSSARSSVTFGVAPVNPGYRLRKLPSSTRLPRRLWNSRSPSVPPIADSAARSGCGMSPSTLPSGLTIPAMFSTEPFGFAACVTRRIAEDDLVPRLELTERLRVRVVLALAVRDRHREYLPRPEPTRERRLG